MTYAKINGIITVTKVIYFSCVKKLKYKESDYETKSKQRNCVGIAFCGNGMLHDAVAVFGGESRGKH